MPKMRLQQGKPEERKGKQRGKRGLGSAPRQISGYAYAILY